LESPNDKSNIITGQIFEVKTTFVWRLFQSLYHCTTKNAWKQPGYQLGIQAQQRRNVSIKPIDACQQLSAFVFIYGCLPPF